MLIEPPKKKKKMEGLDSKSGTPLGSSHQEAVGGGEEGSEATKKRQTEGEEMDEGRQDEIQSDQGTQEYEAIQDDEEIQVDEGVHRETDTVVESNEPGTLSNTIPFKSTDSVSKKTAGGKKKQKKKPKHSAGQQTQSKRASRFSLGEDRAANQTDSNDSPEVVELGSTSAKELQSQRRERGCTSQVMKEKEKAMKEKVIKDKVVKEKEKVTMTLSVDVPLIEISDDEEEEEAFERHWSSKICNECGSSVRHHMSSQAPFSYQIINTFTCNLFFQNIHLFTFNLPEYLHIHLLLPFCFPKYSILDS